MRNVLQFFIEILTCCILPEGGRTTANQKQKNKKLIAYCFQLSKSNDFYDCFLIPHSAIGNPYLEWPTFYG